MDAQQVAEVHRAFRERRLANQDQVEVRVAELLEEILDGSIWKQLQKGEESYDINKLAAFWPQHARHNKTALGPRCDCVGMAWDSLYAMVI